MESPPMRHVIESVGAGARTRVAAFLADLHSIADILGLAVRSWRTASPGARRLLRRHVVMQIYFTGVQGVPVAGLLSGLLGFGFARFLLSNQLAFLVPLFLDAVILQQIAPLIAVIVVVSRTSSAVAVELGNMTVAREVEMLESFGIDPYRHLALPRLVGITLGTLGLVVVSSATALVAVYFTVKDAPSLGGTQLLTRLDPATGTRLLALGLSFGLIVSAVALRQGFGLEKQFTEVPKAASRAVIKSVVLCALAVVLVAVLAS